MSNANEKPFSFLRQLFFPMLCMLILMNLSTLLLHQVGNSILFAQHNIQAAMTLKRFSVFPYTFFMIGLSLLATKFSIRSLLPKVLNFFILSLLVLTAIGALGDISSSNVLVSWWNHYFSHQKTPHIAEILEKWDISLLFLATKIINSTVLSVLLWGLINQATRFSEAIKYYIPLIVLSQALCLPFTQGWLSFTELTSNPASQIQSLTLAACIGIIAILLIYYRISKALPIERWNLDSMDGLHLDRGSPIMSFGFLIAGFGVLTLFVDLYFKNQVQTAFPSPLKYSAFMSDYTTTVAIGVGVISVLALLLGPWLLRSRGWTVTALISPAIIGLSLLLFIGSSVFNLYPLQFGTAFEILLKGLRTSLFFPLMQIAYLSIPSNYRFRTKGWAELVLAPLLGFLGGLLLQAILKLFGTMAAVTPLLASTSVCLVALIALIASFVGTSKGLRQISKDSAEVPAVITPR